jgi:hypothetical protein
MYSTRSGSSRSNLSSASSSCRRIVAGGDAGSAARVGLSGGESAGLSARFPLRIGGAVAAVENRSSCVAAGGVGRAPQLHIALRGFCRCCRCSCCSSGAGSSGSGLRGLAGVRSMALAIARGGGEQECDSEQCEQCSSTD